MTMFAFHGVASLDEVTGPEVDTWPSCGLHSLLGFGNETQK